MENQFYTLNVSNSRNYFERLLTKPPGIPPVDCRHVPLEIFQPVDRTFDIQTVVSPVRPPWLPKEVRHLSTCAKATLSADWPGKSIFLLPTPGRYGSFLLHKACRASQQHGITVVALLPSSTGSHAFHYFCMPRIHDLIFIPGRVRFPGMGSSPFAPSVICVIRPSGRRASSVNTLRRLLNSLTRSRQKNNCRQSI